MRGRMARSVLRSARSLQITPSSTTSRFPTKQEPSGTIRITVRFLDSITPLRQINTANNFELATQYCDGLRGAMVIYDVKDPNRSK